MRCPRPCLEFGCTALTLNTLEVGFAESAANKTKDVAK